MASPAGRPVADHTYGRFPPVAARFAVYAEFLLPDGSEVVVMLSAAAITIESDLGADNCGLLESLTVKVTFVVPPAVGVPLSSPVVGLSVSPAGNAVEDHV
jgi:hypothetical protein